MHGHPTTAFSVGVRSSRSIGARTYHSEFESDRSSCGFCAEASEKKGRRSLTYGLKRQFTESGVRLGIHQAELAARRAIMLRVRVGRYAHRTSAASQSL